ncbi:MAG: hypothetical protein ACFFC7_32175 [Candidatus Hermodarchaeota archaeon]
MRLRLEEEFYLVTPRCVSQGEEFKLEILEASIMLPLKDQTDLVIGAILIGTKLEDAFQLSVDTIIPTQEGAIGSPKVRSDDQFLFLASDTSLPAIPITDDSTIPTIIDMSREECLQRAYDLLEQFQKSSWRRPKQFLIKSAWDNNLELLVYIPPSVFGSSTQLLIFPKVMLLVTKEEIYVHRTPFIVQIDLDKIKLAKENGWFVSFPFPLYSFISEIDLPADLWNLVRKIKAEVS